MSSAVETSLPYFEISRLRYAPLEMTPLSAHKDAHHFPTMGQQVFVIGHSLLNHAIIAWFLLSIKGGRGNLPRPPSAFKRKIF